MRLVLRVKTMYAALSNLSYLWYLEEQRGGQDALKSSFGGGNASHKGRRPAFMGKRGSHYVILLY